MKLNATQCRVLAQVITDRVIAKREKDLKSKLIEIELSPEYKEAQQTYKEFIDASKRFKYANQAFLRKMNPRADATVDEICCYSQGVEISLDCCTNMPDEDDDGTDLKIDVEADKSDNKLFRSIHDKLVLRSISCKDLNVELLIEEMAKQFN